MNCAILSLLRTYRLHPQSLRCACHLCPDPARYSIIHRYPLPPPSQPHQAFQILLLLPTRPTAVVAFTGPSIAATMAPSRTTQALGKPQMALVTGRRGGTGTGRRAGTPQIVAAALTPTSVLEASAAAPIPTSNGTEAPWAHQGPSGPKMPCRWQKC